MVSVGHFTNLLLFLLPVTFIFFAFSIEFVRAQSFSPASTGESASAFVEGKAFYIQGGSTQQSTTNQTFSISLRYSWNTSNPIYTKLPEGPYSSQTPSVLLKDGITWFAVSNQTFVTYNITDGNITQRASASMYSKLYGQSAVFDEGLGEIVLPNGWSNGLRATTLYVNPGNFSIRANSLAEFNGLARYSLVSSESTQRAYLFGGSTPPSAISGLLYERKPTAIGNWSPINTTYGGPKLGGPSARESACMVPAFNGNKLILFGGSGPTASSLLSVVLSDIYIYDVANGSWIQGADAGATRARAAHACAVSGDALIAWGGYSDTSKSPPGEVTAVYNLTTNKWVDKFVSPNGEQVSTPISTPSPTSTAITGSDSRSESNTGAIIGGIAGAVVLLAGVGFVVWRQGSLKKRRMFSNSHQQQSDRSHIYKEEAEKIRDPQSTLDVPSAPQSAAQNFRHPQLRTSQQEQAHHQQGDEGLYAYRDPFARSNNPHADLNVQRAPQIPPRPTNSFRNPQLDILRREREVAAELEMLRIDKGNTPQVQCYDNWSTHRRGNNGSPHA
ncbi:hypothetical protein MVEG_10849 [Podila verticillata NRRL 6337]|nr:hypothetical protein MVEG_10849 [Podila verticillata NRRL 6337]